MYHCICSSIFWRKAVLTFNFKVLHRGTMSPLMVPCDTTAWFGLYPVSRDRTGKSAKTRLRLWSAWLCDVIYSNFYISWSYRYCLPTENRQNFGSWSKHFLAKLSVFLYFKPFLPNFSFYISNCTKHFVPPYLNSHRKMYGPKK